ncbi:MAG: hypothetical protein K5686_13280 [Lachnospiraceae bacterium]|nr:hypothetical protein [Lachnospiraceae bacterium]
MLDSVMTTYRKLRQGLIGTLSGAEGIVYEETKFYDLGYMQVQLKRVKKELSSVENSLAVSIRNEEATPEVKRYRTELMNKRELLKFHMILIMSNSFANLEDCRKLAEGHDFAFMKCVEGLEEYKKGNKGRAFDLLDTYYREYGKAEDHYLVNKVYGLLLYEAAQYDKAIPFLSYAAGFMPDEQETLEALKNCYAAAGKSRQQKIMEDINSLLFCRR